MTERAAHDLPALIIAISENAPAGICFMPVTDSKTVKNRLHLDLTTSAQDRDQEIERLLALGTRRVRLSTGRHWRPCPRHERAFLV